MGRIVPLISVPRCVAWLMAIMLAAHAGVASGHNLRTTEVGKLHKDSHWVNHDSLPKPGATVGDTRKSFYFRPVSTTLYCVMLMTVQSLLIHTGLSLCRNADELTARSKPSLATETFAAASRPSVFPSMLCMLFVGCRMYVLATTEGLGEPPQWVKASMWVATGGMTLQFILVFTLPFISSTPEEVLTGGNNDVHAMLRARSYKNPATGKLLFSVQCITMILVYCGSFGVFVGVATFPMQSTKVSPAVVCICIMAVLYLLVYLTLWFVRAFVEKKVELCEEVLAEQEGKMLKQEAEMFNTIRVRSVQLEHLESKKNLEADEMEQIDKFLEKPIEFEEEDVMPSTLKRQNSETTQRWQRTHEEFQKRFFDCHRDLAYMVQERKDFAKRYRAEMLTPQDLAAKGMAMNMSMSVKKVPMMAVLFLATRMRALQLDPPYGMPPVWAQCCFAAMTAALFVEVAIAGYIGYTGREEQGYYGIYTYHSRPVAHMAHHACLFLIYVGLIPVAIAVFAMKDSTTGKPAPLSPTIKCVMWLELVYFAVLFVQWLTSFLQDILKKTSSLLTKMRDTCLAAGVSLTCAPLLCILFVACRMRALQITQQKGNPPGWAQDCMFMCIVATAVQVFCCLLMPIFTSDAAEVDDEGNVSYDASPMAGAYLVTVVKYIALMMLHGGVFMVCVAVCVMTPETCMWTVRSFDIMRIVKLIAVLCFVMLVALLLSSAKVVGLAIKFALEECGERVLGTKIEVNKSAFSLVDGYVNVMGLRIENPKVVEDHVELDYPWSSDCLLRVKTFVVKVSVWKLVKSLGKEFELTAIKLEGIHVNYEKWSMARDSNVNLILAHMKEKGFISEEESSKASAKAAPPQPELKKDAPPPEPQDPENSTKVNVLEVKLEDIQAHGILSGVPISAAVADIKYENFTDETGGGSATTIVSIILKTVLASILANFTNVGAATASVLGHVGSGVSHAVGSIYNLFTGHSHEESEKRAQTI